MATSGIAALAGLALLAVGLTRCGMEGAARTAPAHDASAARSASPSAVATATWQPREPVPTSRPEPSATAFRTLIPLTPPAALALEQARPPELDGEIPFMGILPAHLVDEAVWSPDRTLLAYTYQGEGGRSGVEAFRPGDSMLLSRWVHVGRLHDVIWSPDGSQVLFLVGSDPTGVEKIGLGRPGASGWEILAEGLSFYNVLDQWLDGRTLLCWAHSGTQSEIPYKLDLPTGKVATLGDERWNAPGPRLFGIRLSADRRWFAATDAGCCPRTVVGRWDKGEERDTKLPLADGENVLCTNAQFWSDHALAFLACPPGEGAYWCMPASLDLYLWDAQTGERRWLARDTLGAFVDPTETRVAVVLAGSPRRRPDGVLSAEASTPQLALMSWPEWELVGSYPLWNAGDGEWILDGRWALLRNPPVVWSPDGSRLLFRPEKGGLAWMDRDGREGAIVAGRLVEWAGWGADGMLALVVDGRIWLIRVQ